MHNETTVIVENISKKFCRDLRSSFMYGAQDVAREITGFGPHFNLRNHEFWAIQNINFQLKRGEAIGLIGSNGCGKTTLLKIMSGLIKPTKGSVLIRGRIAPLIALGAGFNPILTGRENVYINLAILGLTNKEIAAKFKEVVDFSEIWEAIDAPLRTYSSGMAARLGFACAIHTDPDVLFVDEVLAVGDARFRVKCYQRLAELRSRGTSLILVSHSANAVLSICERSIYIKKGELAFSGSTEDALQIYQQDQDQIGQTQAVLENKSTPVLSENKITAVQFSNVEGLPAPVISSGRRATLTTTIVGPAVNDISLNVHIRKLSGDRSDVLIMNSRRDGLRVNHNGETSIINLNLPACGLKAGKYFAKLTLASGQFNHVLDIWENFVFSVEPDASIGSSKFNQAREWTLSKIDERTRHVSPPPSRG